MKHRAIKQQERLMKNIKQQVRAINHKPLMSIRSVHDKIAERIGNMIWKYNQMLTEEELYAVIEFETIRVKSRLI